jgi:glutaredoxin-like protein NrdH
MEIHKLCKVYIANSLDRWYTLKYLYIEEGLMQTNEKIKLYTLSTCSHCIKAKQFFKDKGIETDCVDVDLATGEERQRLIAEVKKLNPECTFPTICIGDCVIAGFDEGKVLKALEAKS